jgi:hypothetical protein
MILAGRYGQVCYDPTGGAPTPTLVPIASINTWKLSQKTDKINVTCFQDKNKKYVMGLKDIQGTMAGFWDSSELTLFEAVDAPTPGLLQLIPNTEETVGTAPGVVPAWEGLAYIDVDIDTNVNGAPAVSSSFVAAGDWAMNLLSTGSLAHKAA